MSLISLLSSFNPLNKLCYLQDLQELNLVAKKISNLWQDADYIIKLHEQIAFVITHQSNEYLKKLQQKGLVKVAPGYYDQCIICLQLLNLKQATVIIINKNYEDLYQEIITLPSQHLPLPLSPLKKDKHKSSEDNNIKIYFFYYRICSFGSKIFFYSFLLIKKNLAILIC